MPDLILRRRLSESTLPLNIALRGVVDVGETAIKSVEIFCSFDDDPTLKPQFVGVGKPGETFRNPNDNYKRPIRYFLVGVTEKGLRHVSDLKEATQQVYTPTTFDKTVATGVFTLFRHAFVGWTYTLTDEIFNDGAGNFYNYLMPAGTFEDGESIQIEYGWHTGSVAPGVTRTLTSYFAGTPVGSFTTTEDGSGRTLIILTRQGTSVWATVTNIFTNDPGFGVTDDSLNETVEITGLDLDADDYEIKLVGNTPDASGVLSVAMGVGYKIPAPFESDIDYLTGEGGDILFGESGTTALTGE